jgi:Toprim domain
MIRPVEETLILVFPHQHAILTGASVELPSGNRKRRCPFRFHPDRNPSWRWDFEKGHYFCSCGNGDALDLLENLGLAHDKMSAARLARQYAGVEPLPGGKPDSAADRVARENRQARQLAEGRRQQQEAEARAAEDEAKSRERAIAMWRQSEHIQGTPAETYLRSRGITCPLPSTLGFIPRLPEHLARTHGQHPAMIGAFGSPIEIEPGELFLPLRDVVGVHLTLLKPDGSGKADVRPNKLTPGRGHNSPLVLAPPNDGLALVIAEGIEDALSWHQRYGAEAWAAGTAVRLGKLARHIPDYTDFVSVLCDDDPAGISACSKLFDDLEARDIETQIVNVAQEAARWKAA